MTFLLANDVLVTQKEARMMIVMFTVGIVTAFHSVLGEIKMFKKSKGRSDFQFQKYFSIIYLGSLPITW